MRHARQPAAGRPARRPNRRRPHPSGSITWAGPRRVRTGKARDPASARHAPPPIGRRRTGCRQTSPPTVALEAHSRAPGNPRGYAQASLVTFTSVEGLATGSRVCTNAAICQSFNTSFSGTILRNTMSGAVGNFVNLTAEAYAAGSGAQFDEFASALADPFIYIDPHFPNASLYSIVVSPDVGNVPPGASAQPALAHRDFSWPRDSRSGRILRNARTSTGTRQAATALRPQASASSMSAHWRIQKPPMCSLASR